MTTPIILLTPQALTQLEKLCVKENAQGLFVNIKTTGCSGKAYDLQMIQEVTPEMMVYPQANGYFVAIDKKDFATLSGTTLDYVKEGVNAHFKFNNPNEHGTCGCGESFY